MLDILQYATSGFWVFVGVSILTGIVGQVLVALVAVIVAAARGANVNIGGKS